METPLVIGYRRRGDRLEAAIDWRGEALAEAATVGKPAAEAAANLPRLFNLCREAQGVAACLAMGLEPQPQADLTREILRDHLAKLLVFWPRAAGLQPSRMPAGWERDADTVRDAVFGAGKALGGASEFEIWMRSGRGAAPLIAQIAAGFAKGEAVADLPHVTRINALTGAAVENSVAARQSGHPLVAWAEDRFGRGPFWRAVAVLADLEACLDGDTAEAERLADGTALAPASRGLYAIRARMENGIVTGIERRTPTDHLLAKGGAMDQAIGSLPAAKAGLLPFVAAILDPCVAWNSKDMTDA